MYFFSDNKSLDPKFDPVCFFLLLLHLLAKEEPSWSSGLPTGFQEAVTRSSSHSSPAFHILFLDLLENMLRWEVAIFLFIFLGQVWYYVEAAVLYNTTEKKNIV